MVKDERRTDDVDEAGVERVTPAATLVARAVRSADAGRAPSLDSMSSLVRLASRTNVGTTNVGAPGLVFTAVNTVVMSSTRSSSAVTVADPSPPSTAATIVEPAPSVPATAVAPPLRYAIVGELGRGGGGDVYEVHDHDLLRSVALKRLRSGAERSNLLPLFVQEAQLTAQLEHPNIVPVHDIGMTAADEPYFTMKRVTGATLADVIARLRRRDPAALQRFTPTRLLITFLEIARGVAYAHARGVVHRDLKTQNILIGDHGEVLVADWGLAFRDPLAPDPVPGGGLLSPVEWTPLDEVELGISGSLHTMAPEQARGEPIDRRVDVYALGVILYELLTGERPFRWRSLAEAQAPRSLPPSPRRRAPHADIGEDIAALCLRCLAPAPADRFGGAGPLVVAFEEVLTGARRRAAALAFTAEGHRERARLDGLVDERSELERRRTQLEAAIKPWDDEAKKQPLWSLEERLFDLELAIEAAQAATFDRYNQALGQLPDHGDAQDALADLHVQLFLDAEARGDHRGQLLHRGFVERHHRGRFGALLDGAGTVTLRPRIGGHAAAARGGSDIDVRGGHVRDGIDGVVVSAVALVERGKRIVRGAPVALPNDGTGGVVRELGLPMGSYLFSFREATSSPVATFAPVDVHVQVGRQQRVDLDITLYDDALRSGGTHGLVQVPAGPFLAGGDEQAQNAGPRRVVELPDFFIARAPVTCAEYVEFLNDIAAHDAAAARRHVPRTKPDGGALWEPDASGRYALPPLDADGNPVVAAAPVMGVSFFDAQAYCAWRATKDGVPWRLPTEDEWEKAARGVDGRVFPWGNGFDPTFCKMATSRPGRPQPEPVLSFPVDESVYGMRDAAGGIREWCDSFYDAAKETRTLRGGAWYFNPSFCRVAFRHGYLPHIVFTNFGFRLARSAPG
jgi:serine/threonine-protein kinase